MIEFTVMIAFCSLLLIVGISTLVSVGLELHNIKVAWLDKPLDWFLYSNKRTFWLLICTFASVGWYATTII